jgi:hypothetical protein
VCARVEASADPCTGHVAAGAQTDLIWVHRPVTAEVPPTAQNDYVRVRPQDA